MSKVDELKVWAAKLSKEELESIVVELTVLAIDYEMVSFPELAPYWSNTGEPLIGGQRLFFEE